MIRHNKFCSILTTSMISKEEIFRVNPHINPSLVLCDPLLIPEKIEQEPIRSWLRFVGEYKLKQDFFAIILVPCSFWKPYTPPQDEFYRRIHRIRNKNSQIKFVTVSVPLALQPDEFWNFSWQGQNLVYECPFFPWVKNYGYTWNDELADRIFHLLKITAKSFFKNNVGRYQAVLGCLIKEFSHIEIVNEFLDDNIDIHRPGKEIFSNVSYFDNTSDVYCHPTIWRKFTQMLVKSGIKV